MIAPTCPRCLDEKLVRGAHPLLLVPCPLCCLVTDPPEPLDLSDEAVPDPEPAFPEEEIPTAKVLQPLPERPTPVVEVEIPDAALPDYRDALSRLARLPIPDELIRPKPKP